MIVSNIRFPFAKAGIASILILAAAASLQAQATRTWVSGVGDDANPGSRTAPCKTFPGAISKTAAGGEISVLDPGGFGVVTITKAITINGDGTLAGISASGTNGIIINAGAADTVVIRNISIKSPGKGVPGPSGLHGIKILQAGTVIVENCVIESGTDAGIHFQPTNGGAALVVRNTKISTFATSGIRSVSASTCSATISNCLIQGCSWGIRSEQGAKTIVTDSVITNHSNRGTVANGNGELALINSVVSFCGDAGVHASNTSIIRISNSKVLNCAAGGLVTGGSGQIISLGNNTVLGNSPDGSPTSTALPK